MSIQNNCCSGIIDKDLRSLSNLANIKDNQVIDIYKNGNVSKSYDRGMGSSIWRTARRMIGVSQNREDIPKIKQLMERALSHYARGGSIETQLNRSIAGLNCLKRTYENMHKAEAASELGKIIDYVKNNLQNIKETNQAKLGLNYSENNSTLHRLQQLEASCAEVPGTEDCAQGIAYYKDKIELFLLMEGPFSQEDAEILRSIHRSLAQGLKASDVVSKEYWRELVSEGQLLSKNSAKETPLDPEVIMEKAKALIAEKRVQTLFANLDNATDGSNVGILIPMEIKWCNEEGNGTGHAFCLSLCKEKDGSYTAAQINAGSLSLADTVSVNYHFHLKHPVSVTLPPVIEFGPLSREEARRFLENAIKNASQNLKNIQAAEEKYRALFKEVMDKRSLDRIPARRGQTTGNCGVRSFKEAIIFSLQKSGKIDLANKLMKFSDARIDRTSLPYEDVLPLKTQA